MYFKFFIIDDKIYILLLNIICWVILVYIKGNLVFYWVVRWLECEYKSLKKNNIYNGKLLKGNGYDLD